MKLKESNTNKNEARTFQLGCRVRVGHGYSRTLPARMSNTCPKFFNIGDAVDMLQIHGQYEISTILAQFKMLYKILT